MLRISQSSEGRIYDIGRQDGSNVCRWCGSRESRRNRLVVKLLGDGRNDDISRVATDAGYREKLYDEYGMKMNTND